MKPGNVARGTQFQVPTRVVNRCNTVFVPRDFALSYHLLADGHMVRFDNGRTPFATAVLPGTGQNVNLNVVAPDAPGEYSKRERQAPNSISARQRRNEGSQT